jgi:hypothetical protein
MPPYAQYSLQAKIEALEMFPNPLICMTVHAVSLSQKTQLIPSLRPKPIKYEAFLLSVEIISRI